MDDSDYMRRKIAGESADQEAGNLALRSKLERLHTEKVRFDLTWDDIAMEQPIGYGGFSQVFKVRILNGGNTTSSSSHNDPAAVIDIEQEQRSYALKCLNPQTKLHSKSFKTGAVDLAIEGEILSRLEHENVIKLHGICGGNSLQAYLDSDRGYFIVLDLLEDTLASKLEKYREIYKSSSSSHGHHHGHGGLSHGLSSSRKSSSSASSSTAKHISQSAVLERVSSVALGVAKGMEYLHSQGVALRDLKPDNIGFDQNGVPKIFDLGFAREVHTIKKSEVAGSLRYMAPEVAKGLGSELASDVYSFGILLWEICTLDKPYKHITSRDDFMQSIVLEEWRHTTSKIPSSSLRKLIKECWQTDASKRPTFTQIVKKLRVELSLSKTSSMGGATSSSSPLPNKGFGSSVNLKRTATWTAKKLSCGISSSSLGVLRLGFKSSNSMNKSSESLTETTATSTSPRNSGRRQRSRSPKQNAKFSFDHKPPLSAAANSPFTGITMGQPMFATSASLLHSKTMTIVEGSEPGSEQQALSPPSPQKPESQSKMRRALPSCPQITTVQS